MLYSLIMAGGSGTRFWPMSRELFPKQFLTFDGAESMLARTIDRILPLIPEERIALVVGALHATETRRILQAMNDGEGRRCRLVVEPRSLNTLPAIAIASLLLSREDPDAVVAVMASDHLVGPQDHFLGLVQHGAAIAKDEKVLITFGIPPPQARDGLRLSGNGRGSSRFFNQPLFRTARHTFHRKA